MNFDNYIQTHSRTLIRVTCWGEIRSVFIVQNILLAMWQFTLERNHMHATNAP